MAQKFAVTRQHYWGIDDSEDGVYAYMVEIAIGGFQYCNPDAYCTKYPQFDEGEDTNDPREAAKNAIAIYEQWKKDRPDLKIGIDFGCTGGDTMPFDGSTVEEVTAWGEKTYETIPKCDRCGEPLPDQHYTLQEFSDEKFCSEYCAEMCYAENCAPAEDEEKNDEEDEEE